MSHIFKTLLTGAAALNAGLWLLKDMEMARNVADFKSNNPRIAKAIQSVDGLCGDDASTRALQHAAYIAAMMRNPEEVVWQDSWNRLRSVVKSLA